MAECTSSIDYGERRLRRRASFAISIAPHLRPKYRVVVEEAIYQTTGQDSILVGIPDVLVQRRQQMTERLSDVAVSSSTTKPVTVTLPMPETIRQGYLEVRDIATSEVTTIIEVLSPANKRPGEGRTTYEAKRQKVLGSATHLVEIDLLRRWEPMPILNSEIQTHYRILVSQSQHRPSADLYAFNLADPIPSFSLPLRLDDKKPVIALQALLNEIYDQSSYDLAIDYNCQPVPPLSETEVAWADALLRREGFR